MKDLVKKELKNLFKKYNIIIKYYCIKDGTTSIILERFGMTVRFDEDELESYTAKKAARIVLKSFKRHPKYKDAIKQHIEKLKIKNGVNDTDDNSTDTTENKKVTLPVIITIDDKKRRIRKFLIEEGILTN
jgi:hypothetical protein